MPIRHALASICLNCATIIFAAPSYGFFGSVCVPNLRNCMCTFHNPCPVADMDSSKKISMENQLLEQRNIILGNIRRPISGIIRSINGEFHNTESSLSKEMDIDNVWDIYNSETGKFGEQAQISIAIAPADTKKEELFEIDDCSPIVTSLKSLKSGTEFLDGKYPTETKHQSGARCRAVANQFQRPYPPNSFGANAENIHKSISGGSLDSYPGAVKYARSASDLTNAMTYARSVKIRHDLLKHASNIEKLHHMMHASRSLREDIRVNQIIRLHLAALQVELASTWASASSTRSSEVMNEAFISPLPLVSHVSSSGNFALQPSSNASENRMELNHRNMIKRNSELKEYHRIRNQALKAIHDFSMLRTARMISHSIDSLTHVIDSHENYKKQLHGLETEIVKYLIALYGSGSADFAWQTLRPQLLAAARENRWSDPNKWKAGFDTAYRLSTAVAAQTETTDYGKRVRTTAADSDNGAKYTRVEDKPHLYQAHVSDSISESDPYRVFHAHQRHSTHEIGKEPEGSELVGIFQYYLETARREIWFAELRRANGNRTMSAALWNEMVMHATECLSGPISTTEQNLRSRPELFDLEKNCGHLMWNHGDQDDYIDVAHLGGTDAALWSSKIMLDRIFNTIGSENDIYSKLMDAHEAIVNSDAVIMLKLSGISEPAREIERLSREIQNAASDFTGVNYKEPQ